MPVTRRRLMLVLLLSVAAAIKRRVGVLVAGPVRGGSITQRAHLLAKCVRETGSARALGQAYLASSAPQPTLETLVTRLWPPDLDPTVSVKALRKTLAVQSRADFAEGQTVSVDGWLLSHTESRLYALTAVLVAT